MTISTRPRFNWILGGFCVLGLTLGGCTAPVMGPDGTPITENPDTDGSVESAPALPLPAMRLSRRSITAIESIVSENANETITVAGQVAQRVAILEGWLYQIQDDTGSVWVLSEDTGPATSPAPTVGQVATVEGVIRYEDIMVDELDASDVYLEQTAYRQGEG